MSTNNNWSRLGEYRRGERNNMNNGGNFRHSCGTDLNDTYTKLVEKLMNGDRGKEDAQKLREWLKKNHRYTGKEGDPKCTLFTHLSKTHYQQNIELLAFYYIMIRCDRMFEKKGDWDDINNLRFGNRLDYGPIQFYPAPGCNSETPEELEILKILLKKYRDRVNDAYMSGVISEGAKYFTLEQFQDFQDKVTHGIVYDPTVDKVVNGVYKGKGDWLGWVERDESVKSYLSKRLRLLKELSPKKEEAQLILSVLNDDNDISCDRVAWGYETFDNSLNKCSDLEEEKKYIILDPTRVKNNTQQFMKKPLILGTFQTIEKYMGCKDKFRVMPVTLKLHEALNWSLLVNKYVIKCALKLPLVFPIQFVLKQSAYNRYYLTKYPRQMKKKVILEHKFIGALRIKILYENKDKVDYQDRILLIFRNDKSMLHYNTYTGDTKNGKFIAKYIICDYKQVKYGQSGFGKMINPTWDEFNTLINPKYLGRHIYQVNDNPSLNLISNYSYDELIDKKLIDNDLLSKLIPRDYEYYMRLPNFVEDRREYMDRLLTTCPDESSELL